MTTTFVHVKSASEEYWREKEPWLKSCGYELRPRYRQGWVPSWVSNPPSHPLGVHMREDRLLLLNFAVIDAIRLHDSKPVVLKRTFKHAVNGEESKLTRYFSSPPIRDDPNNHCVSLLDVMDIPDDEGFEILVIPLLRPFDSPRFDTVGECIDLFQQMFKGLQFIHHHRVAHRDCSGRNLMMDGNEMFPQGWHPIRPMKNRDYTGPAKHYTRTQRPPKYYWIDFGLALQFDETDSSPKAIPMHGNDRTAPEHEGDDYQSRPLNPFPTDIYYLGNLIRTNFTEGGEYAGAKFGFDFIKPLVADMVQEDPARRPTIDECVVRLDEIVKSLSSWKLRSQVISSKDSVFGYLYRLLPYWGRRMTYVAKGIPPIPIRRQESNRDTDSLGSDVPLLL